MKILQLLALLLALCSMSLLFQGNLSATPKAPISLKFCIEDTEFPPFNYFERNNGQITGISDGYDIAILSLAFTADNLRYEVNALPWARCLQSVRNGSHDAAMSASLNAQRRKDFLHSTAYYSLTPSYFYLNNSFDSPPKILQLEDLRHHGQVCGIEGFNYARFGWMSDTLIKTRHIRNLPRMLKKKRCLFFLDRKETLYSTLALNRLTEFAQQLVSAPTPNQEKEPFHMLISRRSPHSQLIIEKFNTTVMEMAHRGALEELLIKHQDKLNQSANPLSHR